jgi:hypothetical protein
MNSVSWLLYEPGELSAIQPPLIQNSVRVGFETHPYAAPPVLAGIFIPASWRPNKPLPRVFIIFWV